MTGILTYTAVYAIAQRISDGALPWFAIARSHIGRLAEPCTNGRAAAVTLVTGTAPAGDAPAVPDAQLSDAGHVLRQRGDRGRAAGALGGRGDARGAIGRMCS